MAPIEGASVCQENVFDRVFMDQAETLRNFCYYKCGNLDEAEDYVQEAFVKLWMNCAKVPINKARGFLFKEHEIIHDFRRFRIRRRAPETGNGGDGEGSWNLMVLEVARDAPDAAAPRRFRDHRRGEELPFHR